MRGKNILILLLTFSISLAIVSAVAPEITDFSCQNIVQYKDMAIGQTLPDKAPFTDEIINIYLNEGAYGNLVIQNKTIANFSCEESEEPTYKIHVETTQTIEDFLNSNDTLETYKIKSDSGEIEIKGVGLGKKIKLAFVKFFLKFA